MGTLWHLGLGMELFESLEVQFEAEEERGLILRMSLDTSDPVCWDSW